MMIVNRDLMQTVMSDIIAERYGLEKDASLGKKLTSALIGGSIILGAGGKAVKDIAATGPAKILSNIAEDFGRQSRDLANIGNNFNAVVNNSRLK